MPDLVEINRDLTIHKNKELEGFDLAALSLVGRQFWIYDNINLPMETALELWIQVENRDGIGYPEDSQISGNKE
jgi:hypothetical protein